MAVLRGTSRARRETGPLAPVPFDSSQTAPGVVALRRLGALIARHTPRDGAFPLPLPGTWALRVSRTSTEPVYATLGPSLCIVAQGAKALMLGPEVVEYDPARMLVFTVDLPVAGHVTRASRTEAYLGFRLDLSPARVAELSARVSPDGLPPAPEGPGLFVGHATDAIVEAVTRLIALQDRPGEADLIGPLVVDEILIRLLRTSIGARVAQIGHRASTVHRIGRAVTWIREHVAQPITVAEMAAAAGMRPSAFHQHFRTVTTMSPLQYQKVLRLQEARRLMLFQGFEVSEAGYRAGYLSPSQFSRDYARLFGVAPTKDIARLRRGGLAPSAA